MSAEGEFTNICLPEHSSDCLRCRTKDKAKQATELVKVQSVLCEEAEISRRRSNEHLPSRTFSRLFTLAYKRQSKADDLVSEVQPVLCEDAVYLKR